jgi:hypothetical protein
MMAIANQESHQGNWETYIVKPAMVLPLTGGDLRWLASPILGSVRVDELAAAMIDIVYRGSDEQIAHNASVVCRGREALKTIGN